MQGIKGNRYESVLACAPGGALIDLVQRHGIVSKLWDGKGHELLIRAFREIKKEKGLVW